jgi:hypothetical protein
MERISWLEGVAAERAVLQMADKVKSLGAFLKRVREEREHWQISKTKELWFRGESRAHPDSVLRPELYRPRNGKSSPLIDDLLDIESELYEEFKRCADQFRISTLFEKYWEWDSYFLLQHHGGPTRLLDWSDGALMALHFAIRDPQGDPQDESSSAQDAFVYILDPNKLNERLKQLYTEVGLQDKWREYVRSKGKTDFEEDGWEDAYLPSDEDDRKEFAIPHLPLVMDFPHITRRVAAQRSRFVIFGEDYQALENELGRGAEASITKITIDGRCRRSLRRELRDAGITESVIYPDLDGLGREMKQLWEDRKRYG